MDVRAGLKEQYHAGLKMLAECVEKCPDDMWTDQLSVEKDERGLCVRSFWRIAYHSAYYTHLYMGQGEEAFEPWPERNKEQALEGMWHAPWGMEPFEMPEDIEPPTKQYILDYIAFIQSVVDNTVDSLDLDTDNSGFTWYKKTEKMSHELMNLRHVQGHVGQLSELLMGRGIDTDWVGRG